MPTVATSAFDRLKSKGVAAYKAGDYATAQRLFAQAAECMVGIAESSENLNLRKQHTEVAEQLTNLSKECGDLNSKPKKGKKKKGRARDDGDDDGGSAEDWVVHEKPDVSFDDIAGLEAVKEEIRLKMIYPLRYPDVAAEYALTVGGGLLLYGPPGTGKTMIAKAIANEIDATFYVVTAAQILSKWVGEAENNIRKLFEAAKAEERAVIFLDEIEAMIPRRTGSSSTIMQRVVPQILQELEGFDRGSTRSLLFVGATNKPWMLDEAVMRPGRFDTKAYLGLPDSVTRMRLLAIYIGERPLDNDVDLGKLCEVLDGYSGADIKCLAQKAASVPFTEFVRAQEAAKTRASGDNEVKQVDRRPISMADLTHVLESIRPSVTEKDLRQFEKFREDH